MAAFLPIRLLRWSVGLLLILFVTYAMMYFGAGDPIRMMFIQEEDFDTTDEAVMRALRAKYGLDQPFIAQFGNYLHKLAQGDWGRSIRLQVDRPLLEIVQFRLPISMQLGFAAMAISAVVGIALGVLAALYHNRWLDRLIVTTVLFVTSIPIFAIGPLPGIVRQTPSAMLEVKGQQYVATARAIGVPESGIILRDTLRHVIPKALGPLVVAVTAGMGGAVLAEASLSFLGIGIQPPNASWGSMLEEGRRYWQIFPHLMLIPAVTIGIVQVAFVFLGDGLNDALDPRRIS